MATLVAAGLLSAIPAGRTLAQQDGLSFRERLRERINERRQGNDDDAAYAHESLAHDGLKRTYMVYVPPRHRDTGGPARLPAVIVLHGGGGNAANVARVTGFSEKAQREGFVAVYPNGTGRLENALLTWNAGHCCGTAMRTNVDDVGFIDALIDRLVADYPVDPRRIYVTGISNGGMMTHRVGRELPHKVAAIAPVVAGLFGDETTPTLAVPALIINGARDQSVPPAGGMTNGRFPRAWDGTPLKPAAYQGTFWAAADGCAAVPREDPPAAAGADVTVWRYACPPGQEVVRYLVLDGGHAWFGGRKGSRRGDDPGTTLNATDAIWAFFRDHAR